MTENAALGELLESARRHHQAGRLDEAEAGYADVLAVEPGHAEALHAAGCLRYRRGDPEAAVAFIRRALAVNPQLAPAYSNLGNALLSLGRAQEAADSFRQAIALKPDYAVAHSNLGNALFTQARLEDAIASYRRALALAPDFADAHSNLANALLSRAEPAAAAESSRRAIALKPDFADAHVNLAMAELAMGDFENGWREYEWRRRPPRPDAGQATGKSAPALWDGGPLAGRTILLHAEQGLGDTLQFLRYCPLAAGRGGRVILEVQPALARLAAGVDGASQVVAAGTGKTEADLRCPLPSLPLHFATRLESIPAHVPYLFADPELVERWAREFAGAPGLKLGLAWAGNRAQANDRHRSIALEQLRPLLDVPGTSWFSLQVGTRAGDIERVAAGSIADLSARLSDFAETAAAMAHLDLVICVDTAVAHLAGALGRKAWVLLPHAADWRWLAGREDSPWYPSLRLFRQKAAGEWGPVVARAAAALAEMVRARATGGTANAAADRRR